ncbi:MAG: DNA polymerase III subunit beta [Candidatus Woykebacteria bacterium RBG_13_40_15]|uniref:Beta sliding clamp n=1 Tax=Candidatus Woykebacteria bacterium RBG_13_40_15 TaxID=1802593 RepID=A0A1G1W8S2_9BACT|nr:MAG: DNA polymerase III subunit beta [Candidatus Woykebacteria bacterium RBG_13_40_15]
MKLVTNRETLLKAASLVSQAITTRLSLPVLGNLLLEANSGMLKITGTNLETTIIKQMSVKIEENGETTVPARLLVDFCQAATNEQLTIKTVKDSVLLESGDSKATLSTINPSEFPKVTTFESASTLELERQTFLNTVSSVIFCAAAEEGRPVLTGILIKGSASKLVFVATDGYRLGKNEITGSGDFEVLIPSRALQETVKAVADQEDETVQLSVDKEKNQAKIETRNLIIISRLLEGAYPSFEQIIPTAFCSTVTVSTKALVNAVKLGALFARDVGNVVKIELGAGKLKLTGATSQVGDAETEMHANIDGEKMTLAFNSRFLLESLSAIKDEQMTMSLSGSTSAAIFRGRDKKNLSFVIMPVRPQS